MPSLRDLRNRISSVKSTRKITQAMQMVAAAKLRRAQLAAESARPYAENFDKLLREMAKDDSIGAAAPLLSGRDATAQNAQNGQDDAVSLLIVMTAERGLCGGFNSSIVRLAREHLQRLLSTGKKVKIMTVGRRGQEQLRSEYGAYFIDHFDLSKFKTIDFSVARAIGDKAIAGFEQGEFDSATIFFNRFKNVITQIPTARPLIPLALDNDSDAEKAGEATPAQAAAAASYSAQSTATKASAPYAYEPDDGTLVSDLLPRAIGARIFSALMENGASEQGARMSAMDNATRNAGDMIDRLTIEFNRSRQAAITNELIEIISGAEAL